MTYLVEIMFRGWETTTISMAYTSSTDFHNVLYTLQTSDYVRQFKVSDVGGLVTYSHFGYGQMDKWVIAFDYELRGR